MYICIYVCVWALWEKWPFVTLFWPSLCVNEGLSNIRNENVLIYSTSHMVSSFTFVCSYEHLPINHWVMIDSSKSNEIRLLAFQHLRHTHTRPMMPTCLAPSFHVTQHAGCLECDWVMTHTHEHRPTRARAHTNNYRSRLRYGVQNIS